jgi:hypothetical protein
LCESGSFFYHLFSKSVSVLITSAVNQRPTATGNMV